MDSGHRLKLARRCSNQRATFNTRHSKNVSETNVIDRTHIIDDRQSYFTTFNIRKSPTRHHLTFFLLVFFHLFISSKASSTHSQLYINSNYQPGLQGSSPSKLSASGNNVKYDFLTQDTSNGLASVSNSLSTSLSNGNSANSALNGQSSNSLTSSSASFDRIGPQFIIEPPTNVYIPNNNGLTIQCQASGQPSVKLSWLKADNSELEPVGKLRKISTDGSLIFSKFSPTEFRPDVHNAAYKCVASNSVGRIVSRTVRVKASKCKIFFVYSLKIFEIFKLRNFKSNYTS